jgi:glutathione S-transferase
MPARTRTAVRRQNDLPVLWQYNFSNFNEKVRWALDFKDIPHVRRSLVPGFPRAMYFSQRGTLPVLDLEGERVVDSTRIIEALERRHPEPALYPADPDERRRALELEDFFDEEVGHEGRRVFFYDLREDPDYLSAFVATGRGPVMRRWVRAGWPVVMRVAGRRYRFYEADVEESRHKLVAAFDRIEAETRATGYLVGSSFSVADLTAAALLYPVAWPAEVQYPYPEPPRTEFLESLAGRPAVEWIREIYRRHRGTSASVAG